MCEVPHGTTTELFAGGDAEKAEITQFFPEIHREGVVAVDITSPGSHLFLTELVHQIPELADLLTKSIVKGGVGGIHNGVPVLVRRFACYMVNGSCRENIKR